MATIDDVRRAAGLLAGIAHHTPLTFSSTFSDMAGSRVYLKCENIQRTGSFKIRGAYNRLAALSPDEQQRGVVAASAGNHAQGVALASRLLHTRATVFMPENTALAKVAATEGYGAAVRLSGQSYDEACEAATQFAQEQGAVFVHAFDDPLVIAGQGTIALEILDDLPDVDAILVPVGGGGLIAGIATAAKALKPDLQVIGVQAAGAASFKASLAAGRPETLPSVTTIADGIAVKTPGQLTFEIVQRLVDGIVDVEDEMISSTLVMILERAKLVVEGAGAAALAALLNHKVELPGRNVAVLLSGGNIDMTLMDRIIEHGLASSGRYLVFETWLTDRPGELLKLLEPVVEQRVNILAVEHRRPASFPAVEVMLTVETRDAAHGDRLLAVLKDRGYRVNRINVSNE